MDAILDMSGILQPTNSLNDPPIHDLVTGLINRQEFERRVRRVLLTFAQENVVETQETHVLFRIDINLAQFELVNETCGERVGEELLREFAHLLQNVVRVRDTLAYLEVNEFGVLMERCSLNHAYRVASKILQKVHDFKFSYGVHSFDIDVSIGIIPVTDQTVDFIELLQQANATCNRAKEISKNCIQLHTTSNSSASTFRGEPNWVADFYQALEEDRFVIYIQPIMPLKEQETPLIHYELLIRMYDKAGNLVLPNTFLPALERYNMSSVLDRWIIHTAFRMIVDQPEHLAATQFFSINLSGQSLTNSGLSDYILNEIEETGIPAEKICFEITETSAIPNLSVASDFILTLKENRCRFALDDFGSGFSSLRYLKNLPVDYLKIDGSFIKNIAHESIDYAMVKSINEMSQTIGMETIAEFVESDEVLQLLKDMGVDYAQGYHVGKPLSLTTFFSTMPQQSVTAQ